MPAKKGNGKNKGKGEPAFEKSLEEFLERNHSEMAPIFGFSSETRDLVKRVIPQMAASGLNILIAGETGTGKDLIAEEIRKHAGIPDEKWLAVHCAAISPHLIESELFGHKEGSFTGAKEDKKGLLEVVDGGALFLDEIGELDHHTQAKLLRATELGEFLPVGGTATHKAKVRLFAATSSPEKVRRDIELRFQEQIRVPPLRERPSDVLAFLHCYLRERGAEMGRDDLEWYLAPWELVVLLLCPWPGNMRELRNAAERSLARWHHRGAKSRFVLFDYSPDLQEFPKLRDYEKVYALWCRIAKAVRSMPKGAEIIPYEYDSDDAGPVCWGYGLHKAAYLGKPMSESESACQGQRDGAMTLTTALRMVRCLAMWSIPEEMGREFHAATLRGGENWCTMIEAGVAEVADAWLKETDPAAWEAADAFWPEDTPEEDDAFENLPERASAEYDGLTFDSLGPSYNGNTLGIPAGLCTTTLRRLHKAAGKVVLFKALYKHSGANKSSPELRRVIAKINAALRKAKAPLQVVNLRSVGYSLQPKK